MIVKKLNKLTKIVFGVFELLRQAVNRNWSHHCLTLSNTLLRRLYKY